MLTYLFSSYKHLTGVQQPPIIAPQGPPRGPDRIGHKVYLANADGVREEYTIVDHGRSASSGKFYVASRDTLSGPVTRRISEEDVSGRRPIARRLQRQAGGRRT